MNRERSVYENKSFPERKSSLQVIEFWIFIAFFQMQNILSIWEHCKVLTFLANRPRNFETFYREFNFSQRMPQRVRRIMVGWGGSGSPGMPIQSAIKNDLNLFLNWAPWSERRTSGREGRSVWSNRNSYSEWRNSKITCEQVQNLWLKYSKSFCLCMGFMKNVKLWSRHHKEGRRYRFLVRFLRGCELHRWGMVEGNKSRSSINHTFFSGSAGN